MLSLTLIVCVLIAVQPESVSPGKFPWEDQATVDSTTTLLHTQGTSKTEGVILRWKYYLLNPSATYSVISVNVFDVWTLYLCFETFFFLFKFDVVVLCQMWLTALTRSSNQIHQMYVGHTWQILRKEATLTRTSEFEPSSTIVTLKSSPGCRLDTTAKASAMLKYLSDTQNSRGEC